MGKLPGTHLQWAGGRGRDGSPVITFPDYPAFSDVADKDFQNVMAYLTSIPRCVCGQRRSHIPLGPAAGGGPGPLAHKEAVAMGGQVQDQNPASPPRDVGPAHPLGPPAQSACPLCGTAQQSCGGRGTEAARSPPAGAWPPNRLPSPGKVGTAGPQQHVSASPRAKRAVCCCPAGDGALPPHEGGARAQGGAQQGGLLQNGAPQSPGFGLV
ncbi:hypothetical protein MC885_014262 [Smutsia gigantea]|nr:hypothetical protein MC885_014262 [Smutsia gigantea]